MAENRSISAIVRNPVLALPAAKRLLDLPKDQREIIAAIFRDLSLDARERAEKSWRKNKGPMAAYWKACGAYATHLSRVFRP